MSQQVNDYVRRFYTTAVLVTALGVGAQAEAQANRSRSVPDADALALQVTLDRAGFSPGEIDGRNGPKTRQALAALQQAGGELAVVADAVTPYTIADADVGGPFIGRLPSDMMESAKLPALTYTSALEALAEKFHASPSLLKALNPGAAFAAGETIQVPNVEPFALPKPPAQASAESARPVKATSGTGPALNTVVIEGATKSLVVRDPAGKVLMYAPVTIGSEKDPLPLGEWKVTGVSWNPVFNYNPDLFWDADPSHGKAKIPPGPNNPVGIVWIDINKEHFGLHGTPEPSTIGRTESHGCVRLTNWDAAKLGRLVSPGSAVTIR